MKFTPKEQAEDLIRQFKNYVYPYSGSGMLSNTYDDDIILLNAKHCATITVETILINKFLYEWQKAFWQNVLIEIKLL